LYYKQLSTHNIFSVKPVSFDLGQADPFGFDDHVEKFGARYLPFTATVRKPAYFIFIAYVNWLFNNKKIPYKSLKEKTEIGIKLEKLLVYCWKSGRTKSELKGKGIIGNRYDTNDIDPFTISDWVKNNCFKLYSENNFKAQKTFNKYLVNVGEKQIPLLLDFIKAKYIRDIEKREYLQKLIKALKKNKKSLFSNHLLANNFKKSFKNELKEAIREKNKPEHFKNLTHFFESNIFNENLFWKKTLDNKNLPFVSMNNWFGEFVTAVDADINNKPNRKLWDKADRAYRTYQLTDKQCALDERPKKNIWFDYRDSRYCKKEGGYKFADQWESYKSRRGEEEKERYFFTFRHAALRSLLKELEN